MRAKGVIDGRKETWTVPDDEDCVAHFRGLSQLPTMFCILNSEHFMSKPSFCTIHTYLWDARGESLVMCKGLSTLQGSGVRVRRVRVRVRTF